MKSKPSLNNTLIALSMAFATAAHGADIETTTIITEVEVSQGSAVVTRTGVVTIPAGQHQLIISGLPGQLDLSRLQLDLNSEDARLGNLQVSRVDQGTLTGQSQQELQDQLNDLLYQKGRINDGIESARMQIKLLDSLSSGDLASQQSAFSAQNIGEILDVVATSSNDARQTIRDAQREESNIDIEIDQLKRRLAEFASRNRFSQTVSAAVDLSSAQEIDFELSYPVNGARWSWLYEAQLDTDSSFLEFSRKVSISQTSGENWNDVALTITTARPSSRISPPELPSLLVGIQPPRQLRADNRRFPTAVMMSESSSVAAAPAEFLNSSVNIDASAYLVDYQIPGTVTLNSSGDQRIFPIDERGINVDLVARMSPQQDQNAYLEARFTFENAQPIQPGAMQFYRDGSFIGSQAIAGFLPDEDVRLPFGRDERIRVEVLPDEERSDGGSTFRRNAVDNRRQRLLITSFHDNPKTIEIVAQLPVSQNDDIQVVIDDDATPADETSLDEKAGILLWRKLATAGEPIVINHYYSIRYPKDTQLFFSN